MSRLIDADEVLKSCVDEKGNYLGHDAAVVGEAVSDAPTVDAVPVVVCSKCKYDGACVTQSFIESEGVLPFDRDTWFCADGERKGGDE